jgi:hypothetical protein
MDLDTSSLWSWTIPLWGLFLLVFFLGGVLTAPVTLQGLEPVMRGGKRVRFADD